MTDSAGLGLGLADCRSIWVFIEVSMKRLALLTVFVFALGLAARAEAGPLTLDATNGSNLSAQVIFDVVGGTNLQVTLTNTSLFGAVVPADILTAVFFDLTGVGTLTPLSAVVAPGSILNDDPATNVGGEWAYSSGIGGKTPEGQNYGIGSSGLNIFGQANFNGPNLDGPTAVAGMSYGIVSGLAANSNPTVSGMPLISDSVIFMLSGLPVGFNPSSVTIRNVYFQYGTSLSEPHLRVPEPATVLLLVPAVIAVMAGGVRARRKR
ncbi:MAG TPA: XDD4 family exosortase-dependent surface protein [Vicinamibacterales bacterium]|jgi:hypothetical protein|nr:XDD4 family exosortase-dependent surface protein [Vicinamibacterales bacterium]